MTLFGVVFGSPAFVYLALFAPLFVVGLYVYDAHRRRQLTRALGELPVLGRVIASSPRRRLIKVILLVIGLELLLIGAAGPQTEGRRAVELDGLDVVIAVDVSKSMLVDDVGSTTEMRDKHIEPTRLARAREMAGAVIDELTGDRVAPEVFAGGAARFPLTEDKDVARRFIGDLGPADMPAGSDFGEALRVARCVLRSDLSEDVGCGKFGRRGHGGDPLSSRDSLDPPGKKEDDDELVQISERGKAIVFFTDGGDPDDDEMKGVAIARELGIAVFFVGFGTDKGGLVYDIDYMGKKTTVKKLRDGSTVTSKRDDASMKKLAELGGDEARFIVPNQDGEIDPMPIVTALHKVNRGQATKRIKDMTQHAQPFLFAGFMLLVIEAAIGTRRRRRYPEAAA